MDDDHPIVVPPEMIVYPNGLNSAMEGLAREIILTNPKDLYAFAASYFEKLIDIRKKTAVNGKFFEIEDIVRHKIKHTKYGQEDETNQVPENIDIIQPSLQTRTLPNETNIENQPTENEMINDEKQHDKKPENIRNDSVANSPHQKISLPQQLTFDLVPKDQVEDEVSSPQNDEVQVAEENDKSDANDDDNTINNLQETDQPSQIVTTSTDEKQNLLEKISSLDQNKEDDTTAIGVDTKTIDDLDNDSSEENVNKSKDENKKDFEISNDEQNNDLKTISAEMIENVISNTDNKSSDHDDANEKFIRQESVAESRQIDDKSPDLVDDVFLPSEIKKIESQKSKSTENDTVVLNETQHNNEALSPKEEKLEEVEISEKENVITSETTTIDPVEIVANEIENKEDNQIVEQKISSDEITTMDQDNDSIIKEDDYTLENQKMASIDCDQESNDFNEEYNKKDEDKKPSLQKEISFQELTDIANIVQDLIVSEGVTNSSQSSEEKAEIANIESVTNSEKIPDVNETSITDNVMSSVEEKADEPLSHKTPDEIINEVLDPTEIQKCDDTERFAVQNDTKEISPENTEHPNLSSEGNNSETHPINDQIEFSVKTSLKSEDGEKQKLFEKASIMIQKVFRGFMVRSKLSKKTTEKSSFSQAEENEVESANTMVNDNELLSAVPEEKVGSSTEDESSTFSSAATKIQSGVRGFLTRKSFQQNKTDNSSDTTAPSIGDSRSFDDNDDTISRMIIATTSIIIDQLEHFDKIEKRSSKGSIGNFDSIDVGGEEKRKRLKREDAIQVQSPFSSGENPTPKQEKKMNEDDENMGDLAKNIILDIVTTSYETSEKTKSKKKRKWVPPETDYGVYIPLRDYSESVDSNDEFSIPVNEPLKITEIFDEPATESTMKIPELAKNLSVASDDGDVIIAPVSARSNKSSQSQANLRTFSSAERERVEKDDTVSPLPSENPEPTKRSDSLVTMNSFEDLQDLQKQSTGLLHSGEFHDMALPTKVERRPTSSQKDEMS